MHRQVVLGDLPSLREEDPDAADALVDAIRRLETTTRGGQLLDQAGWRAFESVPSFALIAAGSGLVCPRPHRWPTTCDLQLCSFAAGSGVAPALSNVA